MKANKEVFTLEQAFGAVLLERRKALGLRQVDLENVVEGRLDRSYISRLERGEHEVGLVGIFHIAKALAMSPEELIAAVAARWEHNQHS